MRFLIVKYKDMFRAGSTVVNKEFLDERLASGKLTQEEYNYIIAE